MNELKINGKEEPAIWPKNSRGDRKPEDGDVLSSEMKWVKLGHKSTSAVFDSLSSGTLKSEVLVVEESPDPGSSEKRVSGN